MSNDEFLGPYIFEQGKDPGAGKLRLVADKEKLDKIESGREVTLLEIYQVLFGMGRSIQLEEFYHEGKVEDVPVRERRFKAIGLTNAGKPLIVIFAPLEEGGFKKKLVTAWRHSRKSIEVEKLLNALPQLRSELIDD